jgi:hypothetical protein
MENLQSHWVKVSKSAPLLPISTSLIYKWKHRGQHLEIFSKIGGNLFIDVAAVERLLEAGRLGDDSAERA